MRQTFIKDGVIRSFEVKNGKVRTTIKVGHHWVGNPTLEQFYAQGWEDYVPPIPEPPSKMEQYRQRVAELVREEYSEDAEFAIHRRHFAVICNGNGNGNGNSKGHGNGQGQEEQDEDFERYNAYCEECEERAYREIFGESDSEFEEPQVRQ